MKTLVICLTSLWLSSKIYAQDSQEIETRLIQHLFNATVITDHLEDIANKPDYQLILPNGTIVYTSENQNDSLPQFTLQILKIKQLGEGHYKVKLTIDAVKINSKVLFDEYASSQVIIENLFIRDSNWLFNRDGYMYWKIQS